MWLKELNVSWLKELIFDNDSKNLMFEKENWRKKLNFLEYDAKNWTFLEYDAKNCNFFDWNNWTAFQFDSKTQKNWTASDLWLKGSELFSDLWLWRIGRFSDLWLERIGRFSDLRLKRIEPFSDLCLERIEPFFPIWLKELFFVWFTELNFPREKYDSKERNRFFFPIIWLKERNRNIRTPLCVLHHRIHRHLFYTHTFCTIIFSFVV